jgi:hypothetical protein
MPKPKIVTHHEFPPIPPRDFDWIAHRAGDEEGGFRGYGKTEAEAVAELRQLEEDSEPTRLAYPLRAFLDLSTGHLSPETRAWMEEAAGQERAAGQCHGPHWVAATPYGWFLYADEEPKPEDYPADLIACMVAARKRGAEYILFDSDADRGDGLAELPWCDA